MDVQLLDRYDFSTYDFSSFNSRENANFGWQSRSRLQLFRTSRGDTMSFSAFSTPSLFQLSVTSSLKLKAKVWKKSVSFGLLEWRIIESDILQISILQNVITVEQSGTTSKILFRLSMQNRLPRRRMLSPQYMKRTSSTKFRIRYAGGFYASNLWRHVSIFNLEDQY